MHARILRADKTHLDALAALSQSFADEGITRGLVASEREHFAHMTCWICLDEEDRAVGYCSGSIRSTGEMCVFPPNAPLFEVDELYVLPPWRGQGIGSRLLERTERDMRAQGVEYFLLSTATKDHRRILGFYQRQGYTAWTTTLFKSREEG